MKRDTMLYDFELTEVDKANKILKMHNVDFSTQFDEWIPFDGDEESEYVPFFRREKRFIPTNQSFENCIQSFQ